MRIIWLKWTSELLSLIKIISLFVPFIDIFSIIILSKLNFHDFSSFDNLIFKIWFILYSFNKFGFSPNINLPFLSDSGIKINFFF